MKRTETIDLIVALVAVMFLLGCEKSSPTSEPTANMATAQTEAHRGPVRVTVEVTPEPARLSDEPTLTLSIEYESGVTIDKPPFGDAFGDFIIRDFREPFPETHDDREIIRQIYTLEPTTTGPLQIDPIAIQFTDNRESGDATTHTVETEALTINVLSVVKSEAPSLNDLEGFAGPIDLPTSRSWIGWLLSVLIVVAITVCIVVRRICLRSDAMAERQLTPRELAIERLDKLWRNDSARGEAKVFYVELTDIVRQYIEGTTDIHAPEQTTEEFLREIGTSKTFSPEERQRFQDFLESADLVKFAAHEPTDTDMKNAYGRARVFVDTGEREAAA